MAGCSLLTFALRGLSCLRFGLLTCSCSGSYVDLTLFLAIAFSPITHHTLIIVCEAPTNLMCSPTSGVYRSGRVGRGGIVPAWSVRGPRCGAGLFTSRIRGWCTSRDPDAGSTLGKTLECLRGPDTICRGWVARMRFGQVRRPLACMHNPLAIYDSHLFSQGC